jgi:omega-amidase
MLSQHLIMKVACCQLDIVWESKEANFAKVEAMIAAARLPARTLIVLPEMFATGFSFDLSVTAEPFGGATEQFLARLARSNSVYLVAGLIGCADAESANQAVLFGPDGTLKIRYSKIFPFTGAGEHTHHAAGSEVPVFDCNGFKTAMFVCYDLRFPELFRAAAVQGAELMIVIANWPEARIQHWITLLQARAIENQAYVIGVNRVGRDPRLSHPGRSMIIDPHGAILADAGEGESLVTADIDLGVVREWRRDFPALRDIRLEFLSEHSSNSLA